MMNSEKGQAFPLALVALAVGSLVIAPFLAHASSSLIGSRVYEQEISRLYSADAGVEYAIWHLQDAESEVPEFTINNRTVDVTIQDAGELSYRITATATSDDGSSYTIESNVSLDPFGNYTVFEGSFRLDEDEEEEYTGNVYAKGNVYLDEETRINGNVYAEGNVILDDEDAIIDGKVYAEGNVILDEATITDDLCALGNVDLDEESRIYGDVYVLGDLILDDNSIIYGDVYVGGNIELHGNSRIEGNIYTYEGWPELVTGSIYIITWEVE